jgi:hypothetical protein
MFRSPMPLRVLRGRIREAALWAMVPMSVFHGRPVVGCLCADGRYDAACPGVHRVSQPATASPCCCATREAKSAPTQPPRQCCPQEPQGGAQGPGQDCPGPLVKSQTCCRAVVHAPVSPPLVSSTRPADDSHLPAVCIATPWAAGLVDVTSLGCRVEDDTGLPGVDLVVTLGRLII